jgi:hypothetical protein
MHKLVTDRRVTGSSAHRHKQQHTEDLTLNTTLVTNSVRAIV